MEFTQAVYIAKKDCKTDRLLANFVNTYPERKKMNIMFLRESEGVYQFGQKRVYIKVEKGEKILVRVGGGYLGIEEFIKTYTKEEVEKINRKNVALNYQEKIAVQKLADLIPSYARETSPIGRQQNGRSPTITSTSPTRNSSPAKTRYAQHRSNNSLHSYRNNSNLNSHFVSVSSGLYSSPKRSSPGRGRGSPENNKMAVREQEWQHNSTN